MGDQDIRGVTQPYLYVGVWRSLFGWHKEDLDLYSINYLHTGASKVWYSVDLDCNEAFEKLARENFKDCFKELMCSLSLIKCTSKYINFKMIHIQRSMMTYSIKYHLHKNFD